MTSPGNKTTSCAILFSGGTDSTCTAALMAGRFSEIHLLTFYQGRPKTGSQIAGTVASLQEKFTDIAFVHRIINTEKLVKHISYDRYAHYLVKHKLLVLSTCGFTTLSWHVRAIVYCLQHGIHTVADGLTKELMHFPGHMDEVIGVFRQLYKSFGIEYINPVREWTVPPDQQFIDRLVVDQHGFFFPRERQDAARERTTGKYLYDLGLMPNPNVKGSRKDQNMQYDCYPFVLYNMMAFWIYLPFMPYETFCRKMRALFEEKARDMKQLLDGFSADRSRNRLLDYVQ